MLETAISESDAKLATADPRVKSLVSGIASGVKSTAEVTPSKLGRHTIKCHSKLVLPSDMYRVTVNVSTADLFVSDNKAIVLQCGLY